MPASDTCGGCGKTLDVEKPVYPHERFGLLCRDCHDFALMCDTEAARLRELAEYFAALDLLITVPRGGLPQ